MDKRIVETIAALERDGSLSPAQGAEVARRLDAALLPPDRGARFVTIVASLGAGLVAAGLLYLVGYNWAELSKTVKLGLIFGLWAAIHAAGWWSSASPGRHPALGTAFTVLGVLCFGAAIGLVAQIYNLSSHYPNAVLAWWALNVPVLLWSRSRSVQVAVTGLFVLWCFWHLGVYMQSVNWGGFDEEVIGFGLLAAGLSVLFCGLSEVVGGTTWERFAPLWRGLAWLGALVGPYLLAFKDLWDDSGRGNVFGREGDWLHASRPLHGYVLAMLVGLALLGAARERERDALWRVALVAGSAAVLGALSVLAPFAMPVAGNLVMLALLVLLVRAGTQQGRPGLVNLALAAFSLTIFTRYIEYLWDKLAGAYAFLATGVLLLGLGWFIERQRRRWKARGRETVA